MATAFRVPVPKKPWVAVEDALLRDAYMQASAEAESGVSWTRVAESVPSRTAKQCRERWVHHLAPAVNKDPWTAEEDLILFEALKLHQTNWAAISKLLPGRTDHSIKNRYYSTKRKMARQSSAQDVQRVGGKKRSRPKV